MKIHGTGKYSDFVESFFYCINGENFTFSLLLMMKGGLQKIIAAAGLVGRSFKGKHLY